MAIGASFSATPPPAGTAPSTAPAPRAAKSETPDSTLCIAKAKEAFGKTKEADDKARVAIQASLRDCLRALLDGGEEQNALAVARTAHELFPSEPRAGFDYGAVLMVAKGDPALARAVLEAALAQKPGLVPTTTAERALAVGNLGKLALARGDAASARGLLKQALELDPDHTDFLYDLAAADRKAADAEACRQHLTAALERNPDSATRDDFLVGSWALTRLDRPADAATLLRKGAARLPNASGLHLNLGYALAIDGHPVEALLEYRYEVLNGASDDAYVKEARRQFQDAIGRAQATPQHAEAIRRVRGALVDDADDAAKVLAQLDALERSGYRHVTLDLARAEALYASKDFEGSEAVLRKSLTADPAFLPPYFDLSVILRTAGKDEEARRLVAEAVKRNPRHWQLTDSPAADPPR
jgi:tetratricopeptide (TPR) repeat protein